MKDYKDKEAYVNKQIKKFGVVGFRA